MLIMKKKLKALIIRAFDEFIYSDGVLIMKENF